MRHLDLSRVLTTVLIAVALLWAPSARAATPAHWKDTGFSINANGMTLREVLEEFGRVYGVRVSFSTKSDGYVKGRLKADSGSEFLDRLTQPYKFRWFVYNDTLYIVPRDETSSMRLEVGEDAVQDAKAAIVGLGLFDSRFGWGELPDEGTVIVSGPRAYVNLVRDVLLPNEGGKPAAKGKQIMVFRLKYATAADRVISSRGQSETIPGVKTILTRLLFGPDSPGKVTDTRTSVDLASTKRSREGKSGRGAAREVGDSRPSLASRSKRGNEDENDDRELRPRTAPREDRPRIEADPTLNAIMVYDNVNKRDVYKSLIAELDIEPQQVEIEALIVDIDRSKLSEMGVEWGVRSGNTETRVNGTAADSNGVDLPLPGSTLLISNAARFYARLKALEGSGQAHVLAKPTVLTLDNVAAVLDLSQTSYVPLVGERVADLANVTAGTMLRVVPRILQEGEQSRVRLEVDIEDGALGDASLKSNVTRSTISTQAIIDLQQTLMIGGYRAESVSNNQQKVPLLGDVPVLGNLFRSNTESFSTRERLFLITPRITGSTGVTARARSEAAKSARKVALADTRTEEVPQAASAQPASVIDKSPVMQEAPSTAPATPAAVESPAPVVPAVPAQPASAPLSEQPVMLKAATSLQTIPPAAVAAASSIAPQALAEAAPQPAPAPTPKRQCARPKAAGMLPVASTVSS